VKNTIEHNVANLAKALELYRRHSKLSDRDILAKQSVKLNFELRRELGKIMPSKGRIQAEAQARHAAGRGTQVRKSVREKVMAKAAERASTGKASRNLWQEMVRRELSLRSSGRGFLRASARFAGGVKDGAKSVSRYGQLLSIFDLDEKRAQFKWSGLSAQGKLAVKGLDTAKAEEAIKLALQATTVDIIAYAARKQDQQAIAFLKSLVGPMVKAPTQLGGVL
jgi:hypothetical protein